MGIFYEQVEVVNRAPIPLNVRFDGQDMVLVPGKNIVPKVAVQYGKNQNPVMGTQDPENPHISGAEFLIGVIGSRDNCEPLTPEEWAIHLGKPCRMDTDALFEERYGNDPKAKMILHGGRKGGKNKSASFARSRNEAGGDPQGISTFEHDKG